MSVYYRAGDKTLKAHRKHLIKKLDKPRTRMGVRITSENDVIHIAREGDDTYDDYIDLINNASTMLAATFDNDYELEIEDEDEFGDKIYDYDWRIFSMDIHIIYGLLGEANERMYLLVMYAIAKIKDNIDTITNYRTNLSHLFYRGSLRINYYDADYLEPIIETKMDNPTDERCWRLCYSEQDDRVINHQWWILQKLEKIIDDAVGVGDRHEWIHEHLVSSSKLVEQLPRKRSSCREYFDDVIEGEKLDDMVSRWRNKGKYKPGKVLDKICAEETKAFLASRKTHIAKEQKKTKEEEIAALRKRLEELEKEITDE